ncbi:hypothetical protein B0H16DRAFT_1844146 [Mycena metata]|uniref:F-box domain-containing protein n=1 Tax=Mycena metata TaxID=1033252 RepID=A0AAD7ITA3_9AGAR|nr:hypothetical protein B0H16DRAFT_1844146 [Mycena metata]
MLLHLPVELVDHISRFLDPESLRRLLQVSRIVRQLALGAILSYYDISASQIASGIVSLPLQASFLIPTICGMRAIQKLSILPGPLPLPRLAAILAATPPIPDVMISQEAVGLTGCEIASLIAPLCRSVDPVVILQTGHWGCVRASRPLRRPPIRWTSRRFEERYLRLTAFRFLLVSFVLWSDLLEWGLSAIIDLLIWLYRRFCGPRWDQTARIARNCWHLEEASRMHIQSLPASDGSQLTLATFDCTNSKDFAHHRGLVRGQTCLSVPRLSLSPAQQASFFAALDFKDQLVILKLQFTLWGLRNFDEESHNYTPALTSFSLGPVLTFIMRHPSLHTLIIEPGTLHPASLAFAPVRQIATVRSLTAPAEYIPHLLPAICAQQELTITFPANSPPDAYLRAISAIDHTHPIHTLTLQFDKDIATNALPWHRNFESTSTTAVESRLHTVTGLVVPQSTFSDGDVERLARWLALFPALTWVKPCGGFVETTNVNQAELVRGIAEAAAKARATAAQYEACKQPISAPTNWLERLAVFITSLW